VASLKAGAPLDPTADRALQSTASGLLVLVGLASLANPGLVIGAVGMWLVVSVTRMSNPFRWAIATCTAVLALLLHDSIIIGWPFLLVSHHPLTKPLVMSVGAEALLGPTAFLMFMFALQLFRGTVMGQLRFQRMSDARRFEAIRGRVDVRDDYGTDHPHGFIRLGRDVEGNRHFDLDPSELREHVFIPGATGSGKTTTVGRIADGALSLGYGLVVVDCKGGDLKEVSQTLAHRYDLPFFLVDPDDSTGIGYDPCSGDASDISNKLVGVFNYEGAAEIYKHAAQQIIPTVARALQAAGRRVTLTRLAEALSSPEDMRRLGRDAGGDSGEQLAKLASRMHLGGVVAEAYVGLGLRLGALLEGKFRDLFRTVDDDKPTLDWDATLATPAVTYIALRATASSEDVDLMSRMIAQDLKQVCARRIRAHAELVDIVPALCVMDEFAALNEAGQFRDLLLQSRQALLPTVISTQILPESVDLRGAALGAGLIIAHRLAGDDAEQMASQFGTHNAWKDTIQHDFMGGPTGMMSIREVKEFNHHPDDFRELPRGRTAVRSVTTDRRAIVQIYPMSQ
jgi:hypothetical protein